MKPRKPFTVEYKKRSKIPDVVDVLFIPETKLTLYEKLPKGYARGAEPQPTCKRRAKINYNQDWKI